MKQSVPGELYWSKAYHLIVDDEYWAKWSFIAKAVYFVLLRHANIKTRKAYPTIPTIAKEAGISEDSVSKAVKEIEACGCIKFSRGGAKISFRNIYDVYDQPHLPPVKFKNTSRKKTGKCPLRDPKTGRFVPLSGKNHGNYSRGNTGIDTSREKTDKKEKEKDILKRDVSEEEASARLKSQASPSVTDGLFKGEDTKEHIQSLLGLWGKSRTEKRLKESGYAPEGIIKILKICEN